MAYNKMTDEERACMNTNVELFRDPTGPDFSAPKCFRTQECALGINVGGTVFVRTLRAWHELAKAAMEPSQLRAPVAQRADVDGFRNCEFCGCHTNAKYRRCCNQGATADSDASKAATSAPAKKGEPVAWYGVRHGLTFNPDLIDWWKANGLEVVALYASPPAEPAAVAELRAKYNEFIYAVGNKYPGQTRHETALMYIRRAEENTEDVAKCDALPRR